MIAHPNSEHLVLEAERRVDRARQIVARQRQLVDKFGERQPIAVAVLKTFERSLSIFEEVLATHRRNEAVIASGREAVLSHKGFLASTTSNCLERASASEAKRDHQEQMWVARIMEILHGGGYRCEPVRVTLH